MVFGCVLPGDACSVFLNVHGVCLFRTQEHSPDEQDAAAAAQIQQAGGIGNDLVFHQLQAQPGGVMLSGAEAACRVDLQNCSALCRSGGFFPAGLDVQLFPHRERLEVLFPVVRPVLFPDAGADCLQSAVLSFGVLGFHLRQHRTECRQRLCALGILRQIDGDAGLTAGKLHETVLQIVPLAVLLFQEFLEVLGVLYHAATDAQILEPHAQQVNGRGGGVNIYLCPIHASSPFCSCRLRTFSSWICLPSAMRYCSRSSSRCFSASR